MANQFTSAAPIVGHNVTAYLVQSLGNDPDYSAGASYALLGRWQSMRLEITNEWADGTPSSETLFERIFLRTDYRATLTNQIRNDVGSVGLTIAVNQGDAIVFQLTESGSGKTVTVYAGIERSATEFMREIGTDTLEVLCVGRIGPGGASIIYE